MTSDLWLKYMDELARLGQKYHHPSCPCEYAWDTEDVGRFCNCPKYWPRKPRRKE